jgi:hypothetical protein
MIPKHDRVSVRSAKELDQKYDLGGVFGSGDDSYAGLSRQISQLSQTLAQHIAYANGKIAELEKDSRAWFYDGVPTLLNQPAVEWTTDSEKAKHIGDLYFDNKTTKIYLFRCTETKTGTTTTKEYEWVECNKEA